MSTVTSSSVDYITLTAKSKTPHERALNELLEEFYPVWQELGHQPKTAKVMQYHGTKWGPCFYGATSEGVMMRVSGPLAHSVACKAARCDVDLHATRIDVQVTVRLAKAEVNHGEVQAATTKARQLASPPKGAAPSVRCIKTYGAGDSFYLGKRTSETYCRVYDKGAEAGTDPVGRLWRYEVEYKGAKADQALRYVRMFEGRWEALRDLVAGTFETRQVSVPFSTESLVALAPVSHAPTDVDAKLAWLARSVAPALAEIVQAGRIAELKAALGFDIYGIM